MVKRKISLRNIRTENCYFGVGSASSDDEESTRKSLVDTVKRRLTFDDESPMKKLKTDNMDQITEKKEERRTKEAN